jgi:tRNA (adenine22-N1)-methyltransferase
MLVLSDRLKKIADLIHDGEKVADIGTDHAKLPIYLRLKKISPQVILSDLRPGPLEKARQNIDRFAPNETFDVRLGSGLAPIGAGEVQVIVIAGMGGLLTADIIGVDLNKSYSFDKFILQPRNASDKLRAWLLSHGFFITDETLVKEGKFICEIITALPLRKACDANTDVNSISKLDLEISPILFHKSDPLLIAFIERKIAAEKKAILDIDKAEGVQELTAAAKQRRIEISDRLSALEDLVSKASATS